VEWLVNGYQRLDTMGARLNEVAASAGHTLDALKSLAGFEAGGIKFPETKIGETVIKAEDWLSGKVHEYKSNQPTATTPGTPPKAPLLQASAAAWQREKQQAKPAAPPKIPLPPPLRPKLRFHKGPK
jgi:hypothetical protein